MTQDQTITKLAQDFDINKIYARYIFHIADKTRLFDDALRILSEKPKPFVKWVGGKRQLLRQFRELGLYPPEGFNPTKNTYHEPFVGGGAVFFDLLPMKATLNDINPELVTTYIVVKNTVDDLIAELTSGEYIYAKDKFLEIRAWDTDTISELKRAARFIYLNRTAFNGMYRVNSSGRFNVPFGRYTNPQVCDAENLRKVAKVLKHVAVSNNKYMHVLDVAKKGDFIYFDPPYYPVSKTASFTAYSNDVFLERQQEQLRDTYLELHRRGCYVMLSNSDTPYVESLFAPYVSEGVYIHKVQAGRAINSNAGKRGKVSELLVTNYA